MNELNSDKNKLKLITQKIYNDPPILIKEDVNHGIKVYKD